VTKHLIIDFRLKREFGNIDKTHSLKFKNCEELGTKIPIK